VLENIFMSQMRKYEEMTDPNAPPQARKRCPYICIILDDVLNFEDLKKNPDLARMLFNGRHFFIFILFCLQVRLVQFGL
jgi:hypothetical protein